MRTHLVLNFECAKCGSVLDMPGEILPPVRARDTPSLPTGADIVRAGVVKVNPCLTCVEPARGAIRDIRHGLDVLWRATGETE